MADLSSLAVAVLIAVAVAAAIIWLRARMLRKALESFQAEEKSLKYRIKESTVRLYKKAVKPAQREAEVGELVRAILATERKIKELRSALEWHGSKP